MSGGGAPPREDSASGSSAFQSTPFSRWRLEQILREWQIPPARASTVASQSGTVRQALEELLVDPTALSIALAPPPSAASGPAVEPDPEDQLPTTPGEPSTNRWNSFQRRLAGAGLTRREVAILYREEASALGVPAKPEARPAEAPSQTTQATTVPEVTLVGGYVLLRAPPAHQHLLGVHRCLWQELLGKLGLPHREWAFRKSEFYMPRFVNMAMAEQQWREQQLSGPVPVFLGQATRP